MSTSLFACKILRLSFYIFLSEFQWLLIIFPFSKTISKSLEDPLWTDRWIADQLIMKWKFLRKRNFVKIYESSDFAKMKIGIFVSTHSLISVRKSILRGDSVYFLHIMSEWLRVHWVNTEWTESFGSILTNWLVHIYKPYYVLPAFWDGLLLMQQYPIWSQ